MSETSFKKYASEKYVDDSINQVYTSDLWETISDGVNEITLVEGTNVEVGDIIRIGVSPGDSSDITLQSNSGNNIIFNNWVNGGDSIEYEEIIVDSQYTYTIGASNTVEILRVKSNARLQEPKFTEATSLTSLTSGEKLSVMFGKIAKAILDFISHIANKNNPHEVSASQVGALTSDDIVDNLESTSTTLPLSAKQGNILKNKTLGCYSARGSNSEFNIPASEVTIVPLTQFIAHSSCIGSSGKSDGFELNEKGGVIVPFNGHILVSGCIHFRTHGKQVTRGCYIKRGYMVDSTTERTVEVGSQYITDPEGKLSNISSGAIIVPVSDGDIIYLCARSSEATKCSLTEVATQLNITYINYN